MAMAPGTFLKSDRGGFSFLGFLGNPGFGSTPAARLRPGKDNDHLFHEQKARSWTNGPDASPRDPNRYIDERVPGDRTATENAAHYRAQWRGGWLPALT